MTSVRNIFFLINFDLLSCFKDMYGSGPGDSEAQQQPDASDMEIIVPPPVSNFVQPQAASASALGLGLPPAIRHSDSVQRRVTPIPSGQFFAPPPSPILHHTLASDLSTPDSDAPAPAESSDQLESSSTDQPPAPSIGKRGKGARGSTQTTSKASGGRRGRQRAKTTVTTTTTIIE